MARLLYEALSSWDRSRITFAGCWQRSLLPNRSKLPLWKRKPPNLT